MAKLPPTASAVIAEPSVVVSVTLPRWATTARRTRLILAVLDVGVGGVGDGVGRVAPVAATAAAAPVPAAIEAAPPNERSSIDAFEAA